MGIGNIGRTIVVFPAFCKTDGLSPSEDSTNSNSTLFKLDPGQENMDLLEEAMDIVIGAGFEFDEETLEIYQVVDQDDIPATLNDLTQLQVALTYLAS